MQCNGILATFGERLGSNVSRRWKRRTETESEGRLAHSVRYLSTVSVIGLLELRDWVKPRDEKVGIWYHRRADQGDGGDERSGARDNGTSLGSQTNSN